MKKVTPAKRNGASLVQVLVTCAVVASIAITMAIGIVAQQRFARQTEKAISSTYIAEAGLNYYLWHLSHNVNDYCDGQPCGVITDQGYGPFTYDYKTPDGRIAGSYSIYVKPPSSENTSVTVRSYGKAKDGSQRALQASIAIPSFAQYAILTASEIWIGSNETVDGPLHSNIGVHFDGVGNDTISSAQSSYRPTAQFGGNGQIQNGVWGSGGPNSLWKFPVPPVDFQSVTADLSQIKTDAQSNGRYLGPTSPSNPTSKLGYYLELRSDGGIDVYRLTRERCDSTNRTFVQTLAHPSNDLLYVEDNVWVRNVPGQTYPERLTIASAYLPSNGSTDKTITIMGDIRYTAKDSSAAIGLIAQKDVKVSRLAPNNIEINAAMLAQNGHAWYQKDTLSGTTCTQTVKGTITVYGSIATNQYWTWTIVTRQGNNYIPVDGYAVTKNSYDDNLRIVPPTSFPLTGTYSILNYREIITEP